MKSSMVVLALRLQKKGFFLMLAPLLAGVRGPPVLSACWAKAIEGDGHRATCPSEMESGGEHNKNHERTHKALYEMVGSLSDADAGVDGISLLEHQAQITFLTLVAL